jgi:hypothetical protein
MRRITYVPLALTLAAVAACATDLPDPGSATHSLSPSKAIASWGPETPPFNLEVILRGESGGFGLVKFRQPNDGQAIIYLDTWVRDLAPNTSYVLQRAVDTNLDGQCTSTAWLTLGKGLTPQSLTTDASGTAREDLWRSVAALPVGSAYDIHFQVVDVATGAVELTSGCYRYVISL